MRDHPLALRNERTTFEESALHHHRRVHLERPINRHRRSRSRAPGRPARCARWPAAPGGNTPFWDPVDHVASEILAQHCADIGRDPTAIRHSTTRLRCSTQSVAEIADTLGSVIASRHRPADRLLPTPYGPGPLERTAEAVATEVDHR
ncbi:MAG: hypothetical protein R2695_13080 [Acidimicrobiales bacterium]